MKKLLILFLLLVLPLTTVTLTAEEDGVAKAIDSLKARADMVNNASVLKESDIQAQELFDKLTAPRAYSPPEAKGWQKDKIELSPDLTLQFHYLVPENCDPTVPCPLMYVMHGAVSNPAPLPDERLIRYGDGFAQLLGELAEPCFIVVPQGCAASLWWTINGLKMFAESLDMMKSKFNIDTNRVFATGFSDGASGAYFLAAICPTKLAATMPFNGLAMVALMGAERIYLENYLARPIFACNTTLDGLYPPESYRPFVEKMRELGADIDFKEFEGIGHEFKYLQEIIKPVSEWVSSKRRNAWGNKVLWCSSDLKHPRCDWIEIAGLGESDGMTNMTTSALLVERKFTLGITVDQKYEGEGIKITAVSPRSNGTRLGLQAGDIIIEFQGKKIVTGNDIMPIIRMLKKGDKVDATVKRGEEEVHLSAIMTTPASRPMFQYGDPPGIVKAEHEGNNFTILTSYVTELRLLLRPGFVNFDEPINITVNGKQLFQGRMEMNKRAILDYWVKDYDPALLPGAVLYLNLKKVD